MSTFAEVLLIILLVALLFIELVVWIAASKDTSFMSTILTTIETGIHWRTVRSELIISLDQLRMQRMHQLLISMDFPDSFLSMSHTAACHYPEHYRYGLMC